ncbi:RNA polymerase II subunit A C-terminal domain phosphatase-like isoform X2 [Leptotrombidium deliense]|uniref:RNA polymerase II subunit A C-terminal domain phosphatase n=1 Tax=Leptotrombidium deliense TaxID=299467 RepID=A0A443SM25_9ACAR|nr:RNA polymerase II subunit A C-terminal domain phosphatase-like isoform X2 [Leptotrombidium deliense]
MYAGYADENLRVAKFDGKQEAKLLEWKVMKDANVAKGAILFAYEENGMEKKFKSNFVGTIVELFVDDNCILNPDDDVLVYQICLHPTVMKDLCAECGEDLRQSQQCKQTKVSSASVSMIHSVPELRVSIERAQKLGKADVNRLLAAKKLALLVDLDQTLIHTTYEDVSSDLKDVSHFQLYGINTPWYHTKMRPHTDRFLQNISQLYELHICTFGARMYAHKIASLLDPTEKLFHNRILSRDECFDPNSKTGNLKALFPCGDSMVCIIDDREDVWNFSPNVVAVKPYIYFKNTGDINSPYKPDIKCMNLDNTQPESTNNEAESVSSQKPEKSDVCSNEISKCNNEDDDYLLYLEDILKRLHSEYFQLYDEYLKNSVQSKCPDLKEIVPRMKKRTLSGVRLVFSGVIPTNAVLQKSKLWTLAVSLGAEVQQEVIFDKDSEENTTHVIAAKPGTMKVNKALKNGIKVVNPQWLFCASERWEHVEEKLFPLNKEFIIDEHDKSKTNQTYKPVIITEKEQATGKADTNLSNLTFPVYDPVTGKRVNHREKPKNTSEITPCIEEVTNEVEQHNMLDFSPLSVFSKNDLKMMDKEVDDACSEGDEMSTGNTDSSADEDEQRNNKRKIDEVSSDESLSEECPKGWTAKNKRSKKGNQEDDETIESFTETVRYDSSDEFNESTGSVDEEMAAAVEREFLS